MMTKMRARMFFFHQRAEQRVRIRQSIITKHHTPTDTVQNTLSRVAEPKPTRAGTDFQNFNFVKALN